MSASYLSLDDLDFAVEAPADDDIGEPIEGYEFSIDFDAIAADDVMSFDASDMAFTGDLPAPHQQLHSGLSDDDLLEVWFRLEEARQEAVEPVSAPAVALTLVQAVQTVVEPAVAALVAPEAPEQAQDEPQEVPAEVVALSAYALAKAALAAKPARRRRTPKADDRQLALF